MSVRLPEWKFARKLQLTRLNRVQPTKLCLLKFRAPIHSTLGEKSVLSEGWREGGKGAEGRGREMRR